MGRVYGAQGEGRRGEGRGGAAWREGGRRQLQRYMRAERQKGAEEQEIDGEVRGGEEGGGAKQAANSALLRDWAAAVTRDQQPTLSPGTPPRATRL